MSLTVNVQDAKTRLSELLKRVEAGEGVVIARAGHPIAELRPVRPTRPVFGMFADLGPVPDDAFDPLSDDELADWESVGDADPLTSGSSAR
ncbi:MAG: type II toxin-antitoxin system prevent-host-death family antitoxin [Aeromicrobium sp.]|uniref:type II toxin-antitoxin system Phd/YefM family antitoxin n=1 Tax=Aeromicrobium sp. TaxID=1871063 RepID=UPI0039E291A3